MTAKRYFKRMWEDEFYIFDSETISEKEFDEKVEYEGYQAFADSMLSDEVVELLNELNNKCEVLEIENESFEDGATRYAKLYHESLKENEQLKSENKKLNERIGILEGSLIDKGFDIND